MIKPLVLMFCTLCCGFTIGTYWGRWFATPDWPRCVASFGPNLDHYNVVADTEHGVSLTMYGSSGKTLHNSIYPTEAHRLARLLDGVADTKEGSK